MNRYRWKGSPKKPTQMFQAGCSVNLRVVSVTQRIGVHNPGTEVVRNVGSERSEQRLIEAFCFTVCLQMICGREEVFHIQYLTDILKEA